MGRLETKGLVHGEGKPPTSPPPPKPKLGSWELGEPLTDERVDHWEQLAAEAIESRRIGLLFKPTSTLALILELRQARTDRDSARSIAVKLENEVAELRRELAESCRALGCMRCGRCAGCHAPTGDCPFEGTSCATGTCPRGPVE